MFAKLALVTSVAISAEISLRPPRKWVILRNNSIIFRSKVSIKKIKLILKKASLLVTHGACLD